MTFPTSTGIMLPEDLDLVHQVYSRIAAEPWFTHSNERREQFALSVIHEYRQGNTDPHLLGRRCLEIAQRGFGNSATPR